MKSKYNTHVKCKLEQIKEWAKLGLTDLQIAKNLGISHDSFYTYKNKYTEFSDTLREGKAIIDIQVQSALLKRALGSTSKEVTKEPVFNKITNEYELITVKEVVKEIPPDVTSCIYWLKNRMKSDWKDRNDTELEVEHRTLENQKLKVEIDKLTGDNLEIEDTSEIDKLLEGEN